MDYETVYRFGKQTNLITYETEHVNISALEQLVSEGVKVYPSPENLKIIQNKISQKKFFESSRIPSVDFQYFDKKPTNVTPPFVWKSAQFGYDGYGVKIIQNEEEADLLPNEACVVENLLDFEYEVAVIVARNLQGETAFYPVVEMEFHPKANQVEYVICPARIKESLKEKAIQLALKTSKAFEHVGLLAVEMFITKDKEILVNEVAPRPHNSGHFSIESSYTNQFEQHLRAILGLPLGSTLSKTASVMVNLVGEENYFGAVEYKNMRQILSIEGVYPHIYGKKETRPFRKMGHITVCHSNVNEARIIAEKVKKTIKVLSK